ncbi:curli assembly protein CsgE [Alcanivorax hongdengensis A-11-3]|uniref:Curli production assembly/transport component CsgE n=1 Tax=Alcanivorax hongdengensis A-11-3 TaxID=1177179 RepID=L0WHM3_9GAMM|nr:curli assembly protein CsgE [Alcanivorax hongdengensis]EKF75647.1 curli assembly protein CsgE [Alcanivorax hongdengensis A-11-3]
MWRAPRTALCITALFCLPPPATAQNEMDMGLVVDQTISPVGKRFYQQFSSERHYLFPDTPFTVAIYEQPSARSGSIITIKAFDTPLKRFVLSFAYHWDDDRVQALVRAVEIEVRRLKLNSLLVNNPDLAKDGY